MRNKVIIFFTMFLFGLLIFFNLGKFVDITQSPARTDIIVSLGGNSGFRIKTALSLYENGFSKSGKIIYTGNDKLVRAIDPSRSKKEYLLKNGVKNKNIIYINKSIAANTMEEIYFLKRYMLERHYKSVIFVSHPYHSRRISVLAKTVAGYKEAGLHFLVVSCNPPWWNRDTYYRNKTSLKMTIREIGKLLYNLLRYGTPILYHTTIILLNPTSFDSPTEANP